MQPERSWEITVARSLWWRVLGLLVAVVLVGSSFVLAEFLKEEGVRPKTAGGAPMLAFLLSFVVVIASFTPQLGKLELSQHGLVLRAGRRRPRVLSLASAEVFYGKWLQPNAGVRGTVLYLTTKEGELSIGGEGFVFQHPGWYRADLASSCDAWLPVGAFQTLLEALGAALQAHAPLPAAPPAPVERGYRQAAERPADPAPRPPPMPAWLEVELETNPAAPGFQNRFNLIAPLALLGFLLLYGGVMGTLYLVHIRELSEESALGLGIFAATLIVAFCVFLVMRKTYRKQVRMDQGILRIVQGPKVHAAAPLTHVRVTRGVHTMKSRRIVYRYPTLSLAFPDGKSFLLGAHGMHCGSGNEIPSGAATYLVGSAEWNLLLQALGVA